MNSSQYTQFKNTLRDVAKKKGLPFYGSFEMTGRCNFNCKMCYVHIEDCPKVRKKELSTEELISIMDTACDMGMLYATLTGGECLLRKDFFQLYKHLSQRGVRVTVKTNGWLLTEKHISLFQEYPPKEVSISIYGSNDEVYERVTGFRAFSTVSDVVLKLAGLGIPVKASITPCRYSVDDISNIVSFLTSHKIRYVISPFLVPPREGISRDDYYISPEEHIKMLIQVQKSLGKNPTPVDPSTLPPVGGRKEGESAEHGIECSAGSYRFCVTWDGFMVPCLSYDAPRFDLRRESFEEAWGKILDNNKQVLQPVECMDCPYKPICIRCPSYRYDGLYSGHCNPNVCSFTLEKVRQGLLKI